MKKKLAKKLSIRKWEAVIKNKGIELSDQELEKLLPELDDDNDCGYCFKYLNEYSNCKKCPLVPNNYDQYTEIFGCLYNDHPFRIWNDDKNVQNAQKVLDLIINS